MDKSNAWVVARWAVAYVLERIDRSELSRNLSDQVEQSVEHDLGYLDLEMASHDEHLLFAKQVKHIADNLVNSGPDSLSTPSIHSDLVKGIRDLQHMIERTTAA